MAQLEKYTMRQGIAIIAHCERTAQTHSNERIDPARTQDNYALWPPENPDSLVMDTGVIGQSSAHYALRRIKKRLVQVSCLKRKDVNVLCDWCVHLGVDVPPGYDSAHSFFQAVVRYIAGLYGEENMVYAWVHMDESSPHLHAGFVPVIRKERKLRKNASKETREAYEAAMAAGKTTYERVDADAVITRRHLQDWHPRFSTWMTHELGYDPAVHTGITEALGGNISVDQLKKQAPEWTDNRKKQTDAFHAKRISELAGKRPTLKDQVSLASPKPQTITPPKAEPFDLDAMIRKAKGRSGRR